MNENNWIFDKRVLLAAGLIIFSLLVDAISGNLVCSPIMLTLDMVILAFIYFDEKESKS